MTKTLRRSSILVMTLLIVCIALSVRGGSVLSALGIPISVSFGQKLETVHIPAYAHTRTSLAFGLTSPALAKNSYENWKNLNEINEFSGKIDHKVNVAMWFADWKQEPNDDQLREAARNGITPEITWEPWDYTAGPNQDRYSLRKISQGNYDDYIHRWAAHLQGSHIPLIELRFAQEMNGKWYPWGVYWNHNTSDDFVHAWQHIVDIFRQERASNVKFVWSPIEGDIRPDFYPGQDYVDIVGVSGFNGGCGSNVAWGGWKSFSEIFASSITHLKQIAPGKEIAISETGSSACGGSRANWLRDAITKAKAFGVGEFIYFDVTKPEEGDWSIDNDPAAMQAIRESL